MLLLRGCVEAAGAKLHTSDCTTSSNASTLRSNSANKEFTDLADFLTAKLLSYWRPCLFLNHMSFIVVAKTIENQPAMQGRVASILRKLT